jgi:hypothetical protein
MAAIETFVRRARMAGVPVSAQTQAAAMAEATTGPKASDFATALTAQVETLSRDVDIPAPLLASTADVLDALLQAARADIPLAEATTRAAEELNVIARLLPTLVDLGLAPASNAVTAAAIPPEGRARNGSPTVARRHRRVSVSLAVPPVAATLFRETFFSQRSSEGECREFWLSTWRPV